MRLNEVDISHRPHVDDLAVRQQDRRPGAAAVWALLDYIKCSI